MVKFFHFHFSLFLLVSGSKKSFQDNEGFEDSKISLAFSAYNTDQSLSNFQSLEAAAINAYQVYPVDCLKFVDWHQDWMFKTVFWELVNGQYPSINSFNFTNAIAKMFNNITWQIQRKLLNTYSCREEKEIQFGAMRIMVNMIKKNWEQFNLLYRLLWKIETNLPIWDYLFDKLSYKFEKKTIDYDSLMETFSAIMLIVAEHPYDTSSYPEFNKLCALFITYLAIIGFQGDHGIFDIQDQRKVPIIYLIQEMNWGILIYEDPANIEAQNASQFYEPFADADYFLSLIGRLLNHLRNINEKGFPSIAKEFVWKAQRAQLKFLPSKRPLSFSHLPQSLERENLQTPLADEENWELKALRVLKSYVQLPGVLL